jgi:hypothetical protein
MKPILNATAAMAFSLALLGCADNSSSMQMSDSDDNDADSSVNFTAFVIAEINNTSEGRDAVAINEIEFGFNDQNNEPAFADLFQ